MTDPALIAKTLRDGGVALLPTDTVYGLAVHPEHDAAVDRLFALKARPRTRNLPIMVGSVDQISLLGALVTPQAAKLLAAFAPGPLTVALGLGDRAPFWLDGRVEIGVRIPAEQLMLDVLALTGPLLVTSANAHGNDTPETVPEILEQLAGEPDIVVDDGKRPVVPSTLVNCNLPEPRIEREGVLSAQQIEEALL
ncbi:L-threonylcarbamoyladenylate synthase [Labedaea rhizosphaerae]|uniref:L-threonylcarbamoyladenylate synthase n=1 Tax=Labedaea rhizosphaerae TaxID=598644 RepID=A0A4R6SDL1_LABRH|nr:L-threonylcarbamoyladenylate synthase [Labedaea rhizosphaerae]TDP97723.1 L-threonylcarbamoyladenylate synthase [Labedaea rhizosphaerae]